MSGKRWWAALAGLVLASLAAFLIARPNDMLESIPPVDGATELAAGQMQAERAALDAAFETYLRGEYRIGERKALLLPANVSRWAAHQLRLDNQARAWGGARVDVPWQRVGHDLYGIWSTPNEGEFVAMAMSKQAVDGEGRHLLSYYTLTAAK